MGTPGFKFRELRVVIDNLGDYPEYTFFLVPSAWISAEDARTAPGPGRSDRARSLVPGEIHRPGYPVRFLHDWVLVAVPRQRVAPDGQADWEALAGSAPGVLHSEQVRLAQPASVIILSPLDYEEHHFRVALSGNQFTLTPGSVERGSDGFTSWLPGLLLTVAVAGVGLWIVWRVRRRFRARAVAGNNG
jgi:hypothetical protein